ncbi:hypothetical protein H6B11_09600 [Mediterraneibacter glycyrrhizinilyticus]|nr:hypothetical protein [Mediterraneibacter glycyrrhizinilyticus]MBM6854409.1 hypothetical protein [Mediterraneibacter glycyrrhizinilyticus]
MMELTSESECRTRIVYWKKAKRNHEVTTATPWSICLVILTATTYVAINFSIDLLLKEVCTN